MHVDWHPIRGKDDLPTELGVYWVTVKFDDEEGQFYYNVELANWDNSNNEWSPYVDDSRIWHMRWDEKAYGDGREYDYQIVVAWAEYETPEPYEGEV